MAWTQSDLDAIDDAIKAKVTGGAIAGYSIAGRSVQHMSFKDLLDLRTVVSQEIQRNESNSDFVLADLRQA